MCHLGFTWGNTMEDLDLLFESWDLSQLQEKKEKKKPKTAKDPVFGMEMTWPAADFFGVAHEDVRDKEEESTVPDSGGISIEFGDIGSTDGIFNPGSAGTGEAGGMA